MPREHKILIAEDDAALAKVTAFNLTLGGFAVTLAADGALAWERLQREHFDFLITDYDLPGIKGSDLCRRIRSHDRLAGLPIILMTSFFRDLNLARLRAELDLVATYEKPVSLKKLVQVVAGTLGVEVSRPAAKDSREPAKQANLAADLTPQQRRTMLQLGDPLSIGLIQRDEIIEQLIECGLLVNRDSELRSLQLDFTEHGEAVYETLHRELWQLSAVNRGG